MTCLCDVNTDYQTLMTWHDMTVWHENKISDICVITWLFDMSTNYQTFVTLYDMSVWHDYCITACVTWHDMTVWHEYLILDICEMSLHVCVTWILNIRHLWHDMTVWYEYRSSDISDMSLHEMTVWYEYWISDICALTWLCDMSIELKVILIWYLCVIWLLNVRLMWHDTTWLF